MPNLAIISERLDALRHLSTRDVVYLDDLREEFRKDLQTFIVGETLTMRDNKVVIGRNLYKQWLDKLKTMGFDYEIHFK
jgi:hypothetical protein